MCQYRQDRTSNTHRTELIENTQMVDPIKGWAEINLHDFSLLPTLQCTLQSMGHAQKYITGTQTFLISKLGSWKHTTAFYKSSKTNRHQELKHLRQYWCYGNRSVIGNRRGRRTFRNWGVIGLSPASRETTQTNERVMRWLQRVERRMSIEYRIAWMVVISEVSGLGVRSRPRLGWMDGVKVSLVTRGKTIQAVRQCT